MMRNINSRFSQAPMNLDLPRSRFDRSQDHKTTMNAGLCVPVFVDEVLPGDTFDMRVNYVCRMSTPIFPVMDNAYLETFFFFVPSRLIWDHWKEFNGENNSSYWTQPTEYNVPQITFPEGGFVKGSVADYMGLPTNVGIASEGSSISALPFRAYVKCWSDWFRDQNVMQPAWLPTDDSDRAGASSLDNARTSAVLGGACLPISKYHDYFTSALPAPQKGPGVSVDGNVSVGQVPVYAANILNSESLTTNPLKFRSLDGTFPVDQPNGFAVGVVPYDDRYYEDSVMLNGGSFSGSAGAVSPANLITAGSTNASVSLLVNDIRLAFQIQKIYENDARGGTRYIELLKSHFGVDSPDGRLRRSEYLGGTRQPININQVAQTSSTNDVSPLGNVAAYSLTNGSNDCFIKSFTEHGFIVGIAAIRTDHTYQQGINQMWSRKRRFDFYWPALANIGEQAILKKEILFTSSPTDDEAFGYQEAWSSYRYKPSIVSGAFRSNVSGSLDSWHYADYFNSEDAATFVISEEFVSETSVNVDRTLAVQSTLEDQFIVDFYFDNKVTRVMPLYSIPGLIDHH